MHNPFAIAVQWPDDPRRYLIHLQRPYFTAAIYETEAATWLTVSWAPRSCAESLERDSLFLAAAAFCRTELAQIHVPIEFIERKHGHPLPHFLMAQAAEQKLFIVEPEHATPLVEVRDGQSPAATKRKIPQRFDVITEWRLNQMRRYYQQFLERQNDGRTAATTPSSVTPAKK